MVIAAAPASRPVESTHSAAACARGTVARSAKPDAAAMATTWKIACQRGRKKATHRISQM